MPCATVPATGDAEVHALVRSLFSDSFANTTQIILKFSCVCAVEKREIVGRHWKSVFLSDLSCTFCWVKADSCHGTVQPVRQVSPVCRATSPGHEGFIWQCKDKKGRISASITGMRKVFSYPLLGAQVTIAIFDNLHHSWANSEQGEQ